MALPVNRPSNEVVVDCQMADLSTASSAFAVATHKGYIVRAYSVIKNAITGADSAWHIELNGTDIAATVGTTVTQSGSAAGDVDVVEIGENGDGWVNEGDTIEFVSNGNSSTTCITNFYAVIRTA